MPSIACQILKFQDSACQILKFLRFCMSNLEISIFFMPNIEISRFCISNLEVSIFCMSNLEISRFCMSNLEISRFCIPPHPPPPFIVRSNWGQTPSYLRVWMTGPLLYLKVWIGHWYGWVRGWNFILWSFTWKLLSSTFLLYCLLCCTGGFLTFESVNELL